MNITIKIVLFIIAVSASFDEIHAHSIAQSQPCDFESAIKTELTYVIKCDREDANDHAASLVDTRFLNDVFLDARTTNDDIKNAIYDLYRDEDCLQNLICPGLSELSDSNTVTWTYGQTWRYEAGGQFRTYLTFQRPGTLRETFPAFVIQFDVNVEAKCGSDFPDCELETHESVRFEVTLVLSKFERIPFNV